MFLNDRAERTTPSRRALTVAGVATLVFSLVVSIGPALAAPGGNGGGGNAGTVKIHDATTNLEAGETGNEPWVCTFWIGFYSADAAETGDWQVVTWPPTGDGTVLLTGSYDTTGDGADTTAVFSLAEGHYRLEWQSIADSTSKHKTFWVACEDEDEDVEEDVSPSEQASPSEEASPSQDESTPSDDESPSEDPAPSQDESSPSDDESPSQEAAPSQEESTPSDDESPSGDPAPSQDEVHSSPDPSQQPEQDVKGGNPDHHGIGSGSGAHGAPTEGGSSVLPDTATSTPTSESGVLATIGVLLILVALAGTRRERTLPSA